MNRYMTQLYIQYSCIVEDSQDRVIKVEVKFVLIDVTHGHYISSDTRRINMLCVPVCGVFREHCNGRMASCHNPIMWLRKISLKEQGRIT